MAGSPGRGREYWSYRGTVGSRVEILSDTLETRFHFSSLLATVCVFLSVTVTGGDLPAPDSRVWEAGTLKDSGLGVGRT